MKRSLPGLSQATPPVNAIEDGVYLVRIERAEYRWENRKPHYLLRFTVIAPAPLAGISISGRLDATSKALWKLSWFLRDFGYDSERLGRDELEERCLVGLSGVLKITQTVINGRPSVNLDAFAPAEQWERTPAQPRPARAARHRKGVA